MTARRALLTASTLRLAYAASALGAPDATAKAMGVPPMAPDARYLNALFGGRDVTVVAAVLGAMRAGRVREAAWLNATCEVTDLIALVQEHRRRGGFDDTLKIGAAFCLAGQALALRALLAR